MSSGPPPSGPGPSGQAPQRGQVAAASPTAAPRRDRLDPAELLHRAPVSFTTERCHLEQIRVDHAPMLLEAVATSRADLGFIDWAQGHWDLERARRFCRKSAAGVAQGGYLSYLAFERLPGGLIGTRLLRGRYIGLLDLHSFDWRVPRCQIGYVGDSAQRGRGLMREAALALMQQAHAWGLHRIEAWCDARNTRSQHFADALGLGYEGRMRQCEIDVTGQPCDQMVYARLVTDPWPL